MRADYIATFGTPEGKRVLADLERVCMYNATTFDKDSHVMAFQEGLRGVYLHITTIMTMPIEKLEAMTKAVGT